MWHLGDINYRRAEMGTVPAAGPDSVVGQGDQVKQPLSNVV